MELSPSNTTMEYVLPRPLAFPPAFLFVIDTTLIESELKALKDTLLLNLSLVPENSFVGLITFGRTVCF